MQDDNAATNETDLELMAYADGMLDHDPARKRAIEAEIASDPARQKLLRALLTQNDILRDTYGGLHPSSVPDRFYRALQDSPRARPRHAARSAMAALTITCIAAAGGWQLGEIFDQKSDETITKEFVRHSYQRYVESRNSREKTSETYLTTLGDTPINWLSDRLSLRIQAPDMSPQGYSIVHRETVRRRNTQMVYLEYASPEGETFSLFLRPRWETKQRNVHIVTENDAVIAVWLDGPVAATVTGELPSSRLKVLASQVRQAMRSSNGVDAVIEPAMAGGTKANLLPDGSAQTDTNNSLQLNTISPGLSHPSDTLDSPIMAN